MMDTAELEQMAPKDYKTPGALPAGTWIVWDTGYRESLGRVDYYGGDEPHSYVRLSHVPDRTLQCTTSRILMLEDIKRPVLTAVSLMPWLQSEHSWEREVALIAAGEVGAPPRLEQADNVQSEPARAEMFEEVARTGPPPVSRRSESACAGSVEEIARRLNRVESDYADGSITRADLMLVFTAQTSKLWDIFEASETSHSAKGRALDLMVAASEKLVEYAEPIHRQDE